MARLRDTSKETRHAQVDRRNADLVDEKIEGPDGYADWVEAWSDAYDVMPRVDACLLGATMYPGYEQYWTAVQESAGQAEPWDWQGATRDEVEYARFAADTPHYALSSLLSSALWPKTSFVRGVEEVAALKQVPGKDIYLVAPRTTAGPIDAGLVDELRLIIHPLMAGEGKSLCVPARRNVAVRSSCGTFTNSTVGVSASSTDSAEARAKQRTRRADRGRAVSSVVVPALRWGSHESDSGSPCHDRRGACDEWLLAVRVAWEQPQAAGRRQPRLHSFRRLQRRTRNWKTVDAGFEHSCGIDEPASPTS